MMKVLAINGSPKGVNSNTAVMINALEKGLQTPMNEINNIYLSDKNIDYCRGCYSCWTQTSGICVIDDDMGDLIQVMKKAEIVIFGSPLYFNNISGMLKVFFDRLTAAGGNPLQIDPRCDGVLRPPRFVMVSNCGYPYRTQFDVISRWIHNVSKMLQAELIGEFYTTNGKVLTKPRAEQQNSRANYLSFLESCGQQYRENKELSDEQRAFLDQDILYF